MKRNNIPRKEKIFIYDYGNGFYKVVKGCFRESGWIEDNPLTSKINDISIASSSSQVASLSRARSRICELALCNDFEYFYTQTFNIDLVDRFSIDKITEKIQYTFKYFKKNYARSFKYLVIAEFHKDKKAIHLHGLISGVPEKEFYKNKNGYYSLSFFERRLGFNSISKINNNIACSHYITKYITKDNLQFSNKYHYLCSRGLKRAQVSRVLLPQDLKNWRKFDYVSIYNLDLNKIENDDNIKEEERDDIISILCAKDYNEIDLTPVLDCVKLRFQGVLSNLAKERGVI